MSNQIKQLSLSTGKYLFVQVPKDAADISVVVNMTQLWYLYAEQGNVKAIREARIPLPAGHTYTLIGKASELTEEQWKEIVEIVTRPNEPVYYMIYTEQIDEDSYRSIATTDVNKAGLSLLKANDLNPETTVIIKVND